MNRGYQRPTSCHLAGRGAEGGEMKIRILATMSLATLLVLALFAGPALAQQEIPEDLQDNLVEGAPDEIPEGMELDEFVATYVPDEVEGVVIEREEPEEPVEVQPSVQEEPEVEVLAEVQERLPVTGGDLLGIAIIGLVLTALGFFAVRRGRSRPSAQKG